jgi:AcrR family transcriptional regulator
LARRNTRQDILSAAKAVFSTKGYRASTVSDIIDEAGVARATFYKYFPNKRHVLFVLMVEFLNTLYENTRNYIVKEPDSPDELAGRIRNGLVLFYRYFLENSGIVLVYYREAFGTDPRLYAAWDDFDRRMNLLLSGVLERGVEIGLIRPIDTKLVASAILMIFLQVPYRELMTAGRVDFDIESISEEIVALVMKGIMASP